MFQRNVESQLNVWKNSTNRKPLILRGARQVGKTTLIQEFSKNYLFSIYLNLERREDKAMFDQFLDLPTLMDALRLKYRIPKESLSKTLLFIDEIQESPRAIAQLRYFYEEFPSIHVIAAGSLLEFALKDVKSFPVGRVEYLNLHPLNFKEYLLALNREDLLEELHKTPINEAAHGLLKSIFHEYALYGGMPEVLKHKVDGADIIELSKIYEGLWSTYESDIEKYSQSASERRIIRHVITTAPFYLDQRVTFEGFGNSNYRSREIGEALRTLNDTKLIRLLYPTTDVSFPIKPNFKRKPKLQFLDTGLLNFKSGIQGSLLALDDLSKAYKGALIPHLITQELISTHDRTPYFWVREKVQSSAEVDLIHAHHGRLYPIEVKSGATGTLKSLHEFIDASGQNKAIRMYAGKWSLQESRTRQGKEFTLLNIPYYLGTTLPLEWLHNKSS